jgi:hypothetical protein
VRSAKYEALLQAARRCEIDAVLIWRPNRRGWSLADPIAGHCRAITNLRMVRLAKLGFNVRQDLLTGFLARVPFESFSGL